MSSSNNRQNNANDNSNKNSSAFNERDYENIDYENYTVAEILEGVDLSDRETVNKIRLGYIGRLCYINKQILEQEALGVMLKEMLKVRMFKIKIPNK